MKQDFVKRKRRHSIIIRQINATIMSQNYLKIKYVVEHKNWSQSKKYIKVGWAVCEISEFIFWALTRWCSSPAKHFFLLYRHLLR